MSLYENIAARLIGTPLQRPAEWLRDVRGARFRKSHPELAEWFREGERTDRFLRAGGPHRHPLHRHRLPHRLVPAEAHDDRAARPPLRRRAGAAEGGPVAREVSRRDGLRGRAGETHGTADFFINQAQTSYSGLKKRAVPGALQAVQVQCRKLDDVIPADAHIGFIKIDVNGAESMVLRGALELLRRDRPAVLLECTQGGLDDYGVGSDDVYDFLVGPAGYKVQLLKDYPDGPALDAAGFRTSMQYPFQAFNFAVVPAGPARSGV